MGRVISRIASRPPGWSARRSSRSPLSSSDRLRTPKPTVAASNDSPANGSARASPSIHSSSGALRRARSSIGLEKSIPVTFPPASAAAIARSPVPQQESSTLSPGLTTASAAARRQRLSSPAVIARFIPSYTGAIRSNIDRTPSDGSVPLFALTRSPGHVRRLTLKHVLFGPKAAWLRRESRPDGTWSVSDARHGLFGHGSIVAPRLDEGLLEAELGERAARHEVDEVVDRLGPMVEAGRGEEDRRTGTAQCEQVLEVDRGQRRLPRNEHELALLLERDP